MMALTLEDENKRLRDLLWSMREEAEEAWRNIDSNAAMRHAFTRKRKLYADVETLIGPSAWDSMEPATHIDWDNKAICHWTLHPPARWPATQKAVKITDVIVKLPCEEDETLVEFVARPNADWNGVTCDACRVRLPTLLREMSGILDDMHEGILEGLRAAAPREDDPLLAENLARRSPERRQLDEVQVQRYQERLAKRAARRAKEGR